MAKNYFMLYYDFIEDTEMLTDEERGRLVTAILEYARGGQAHEETLVGNERFLFPRFRRQADRDAEAYEARVARNAANGRKGGRPRKAESDPENPVGFSETENSQYKDEYKDKYEYEDKDKDEYEDKDKGECEDKDEGGDKAREIRRAPLAPALDDVLEFCRENGLRTDPHTFWNYYQAVGWVAGGRPICNWQAKLREWEARESRDRAAVPPRAPRAAPVNPALNYLQRDYADDDSYFVDLDAYGSPS